MSDTHTYISPDKLKARLEQQKSLHRVVSNSATPPYGSVKKWSPEPYDQGTLGSSVSNALCHAYRILSKKHKTADADWNPSRSFVQYYELMLEKNPKNTENIFSFVAKHGMCGENMWPSTVPVDLQPSDAAVADALKHKIKTSRVLLKGENLTANLETIVSGGVPVLATIKIHKSFKSNGPAMTGMIPMPHPVTHDDPNDPKDPYLGGHEVCIVGYTKSKKLWTVLNSWGPNWGHKGFCYLPYAYIEDPRLALEFTLINV